MVSGQAEVVLVVVVVEGAEVRKWEWGSSPALNASERTKVRLQKALYLVGLIPHPIDYHPFCNIGHPHPVIQIHFRVPRSVCQCLT